MSKRHIECHWPLMERLFRLQHRPNRKDLLGWWVKVCTPMFGPYPCWIRIVCRFGRSWCYSQLDWQDPKSSNNRPQSYRRYYSQIDATLHCLRASLDRREMWDFDYQMVCKMGASIWVSQIWPLLSSEWFKLWDLGDLSFGPQKRCLLSVHLALQSEFLGVTKWPLQNL